MPHPGAVTALSIAGSDPSGGAGIQADLKSFSAVGAYGMCVLCALTAQNTRGVTGVFPIPAEFVQQQLDTVADDIAIDTIKIGMLADPAVVAVVGTFLRKLRSLEPTFDSVVLDPVMVATSGDRLLPDESVAAVRELIPEASLITPNLHEAAVLLDVAPATDRDGMAAQASALREQLGARRVLVKAGTLVEADDSLAESVDLYADADGIRELPGPRVRTNNTHGTGCSLSSAIAGLRPQRPDWPTAVADAKAWLTGALQHADELHVGHGHGPVHHFYDFWSNR